MSHPGQTELVIEAGRTESQYWKDLWRYRELFYFLAWRDILVRYKQTAIGVAWAFNPPLFNDGGFHDCLWQFGEVTLRWGPYPILVFAAMLPWQFFANSLTECSNSFN